MSDAQDKGGRPTADIDYKQLKSLCQMLCTGEECASILGMDYDTLNKGLKREGHGGFSEYFKKHSAHGKASLRRRQFKTALEDGPGSATMQIWLGKQYLEQADKRETLHDIGSKTLDEIRAENEGINGALESLDEE